MLTTQKKQYFRERNKRSDDNVDCPMKQFSDRLGIKIRKSVHTTTIWLSGLERERTKKLTIWQNKWHNLWRAMTFLRFKWTFFHQHTHFSRTLKYVGNFSIIQVIQVRCKYWWNVRVLRRSHENVDFSRCSCYGSMKDIIFS